MKTLILFFISMQCLAGYRPISTLTTDYALIEVCEERSKEKCALWEPHFHHDYIVKTPILSNGDAIYGETVEAECSVLESTATVSELTETSPTQSCSCPESYELSGDKCKEVTGYEQVDLGYVKLEIDAEKKAIFDAKKAAELFIENSITVGKERREKCERSLAFITAANSASGADEATIAQMQADNLDIHNALKDCNLIKARRLLNEKLSHPIYGQLATVILGLLQ